MTSVRHIAAVHPATVTRVSRGVRVTPRRTKKSGPNGPIKHIKMRPDVWETAISLADGDRSRIEVLAYDDCVVHNPGWKK